MKHNITKMATGLMACTVVASLGSVMASAAPANSVYTARAAANQSSNTDKLEQIIDSQTDSSTKTSVESLFDTYKDMDTVDSYVRGHMVNVVVLTIPQSVAQETANHLISLGVKGFWNFTNIELFGTAPDVKFENIHFADSLLTLSYRIANH